MINALWAIRAGRSVRNPLLPQVPEKERSPPDLSSRVRREMFFGPDLKSNIQVL
jgi:hypothetical protein